MPRSTLLATPLILTALVTATASGQGRTSAPPPPQVHYALTNVRIVTAPGKVIERGTVLTRDGRIAAVGAQVQIPAGVVQMDLAGHTVYPGLIDAATSIGLPRPTRQVATAEAAAPAGTGRGGRGAAPGGGRGGIPIAGGRAADPPPPVVVPEFDANAEAADMFAPTADQLEAFRAGGVTTVGLVFNGGIFPGRVGAALTGTREDTRLGLRSSVGQQVSFARTSAWDDRSAYPATGIGALAFIRQAYLDAQY